MITHQMVLNPAMALVRPRVPWIFPGYPPSPAFLLWSGRVVLYVHDLFLMTRDEDLNCAARFYMARPFRWAIKRLRYFLVNSESTGRELKSYVRDNASIIPYRPTVRNVFGLDEESEMSSRSKTDPLVIGALGTIEPRKNFKAAATIADALQQLLHRRVELHIIGRGGWGGDYEALATHPKVRLYGFLEDTAARVAIEKFDIFLSTSHDEGLGLPLLEAQYAGLPIFAPDQGVFREVLGDSGCYIKADDPREAAATIAAYLQQPDWRARGNAQARINVVRWNRQAEGDRNRVVTFLMNLSETLSQSN
jgi:glycosyltransferase involved in cell wall biosynthesis